MARGGGGAKERLNTIVKRDTSFGRVELQLAGICEAGIGRVVRVKASQAFHMRCVNVQG